MVVESRRTELQLGPAGNVPRQQAEANPVYRAEGLEQSRYTRKHVHGEREQALLQVPGVPLPKGGEARRDVPVLQACLIQELPGDLGVGLPREAMGLDRARRTVGLEHRLLEGHLRRTAPDQGSVDIEQQEPLHLPPSVTARVIACSSAC